MSEKSNDSAKSAGAASVPDNHITVATRDSTPKVTTRLIFPGPVVLGRITSTSVSSGTVNYVRLYATEGGDTTSDGSTGSAVLPILR